MPGEPLDVDRLIYALIAVIRDRGFIDLGAMDIAFGIKNIRAIAQALAAEYDKGSALPTDPATPENPA